VEEHEELAMGGEAGGRGVEERRAAARERARSIRQERRVEGEEVYTPVLSG
jgi:hypothetical protein